MEVLATLLLAGLLATLAAPRLTDLRLRSARTEAFLNIKGIAQAELAYYELHQDFVHTEGNPPGTPGSGVRAWKSEVPGWSEMDWKPDGKVRCRYRARKRTRVEGSWVRVFGICDLDADGVRSSWMMDVDPAGVHPRSQHMVLRPSSATAQNNLY